MRKVIAAEYLTLDGVMENPAWTAPYWSDELAEIQSKLLGESDTLLMGRVTYQGMSQAWPAMSGQPGADIMNSLPKVVPSSTLRELEWNATRIQGDVAEGVAKLKNQSGGHLLIYGSSVLVQYLMKHGLIDEYRLMVFPIVVGHGKRLFGEGIEATLELVGSQALASGVVVQTYKPAPK